MAQLEILLLTFIRVYILEITVALNYSTVTDYVHFENFHSVSTFSKHFQYESMENLADIASEPEREPSYMFYNAG